MEIIRYKEFEPDYRNVVKVANNQWADRVPLYEHLVGGKVIRETVGTSPFELMFSNDMAESREGFRQYWDFFKQMGYDTASMEFSSCGILIDGGEGVGRVTKPGLDQPVGFAAINRIPRQMIEEQVQKVCDTLGYDGGIEVLICIPGGKEVAQKTFNPMLGVEGGLSVLGTSGIVEPMSEQALVDTIAVELRQAAALGVKQLILTPGNYGEDFLRQAHIANESVPVVKCSNFIGDALDIAGTYPFESILLVGHIGKLVKLAGGVMNTHSRYADCRTELVCAHAAVCGASKEVCTALLEAATTDACIEILDRAHLREAVLERLLKAIQQHLEHRVLHKYRIGAVMFSNQYGLLGQTQMAKEIIGSWK